jgi:hypothetical protein
MFLFERTWKQSNENCEKPLKIVQMIYTIVTEIKCSENNYNKLETSRKIEKSFLPAATQ